MKLVKASHDAYLTSIADTSHYESFRKRFGRVQIVLRNILRKQAGSENSLKEVPIIAKYVFGLKEDAARLMLPTLELTREIELLNDFIIESLELRRSTKYSGECASYGETLLNCYLDLFIALTVRKTPRHIGTKPSFLVNPATGANLELDVILEDFRLAFEFQGEHHYLDTTVTERDKFKLAECANFQRILIPVNPYQLQSAKLQVLILNSIKDQLNIGTLFMPAVATNRLAVSASNKQLLLFSKIVQRIFLSIKLFARALRWVDAHSAEYISKISSHSPISTSTPAPRPGVPTSDLTVENIYKQLFLVKKLRKGNLSSGLCP